MGTTSIVSTKPVGLEMICYCNKVYLKSEIVNGSFQIYRAIEIDGALDDLQEAKLLEIDNKCQVHKVLPEEIARIG